MIEEKTDNKTIAKNTVLLYVRMMFTMCVSLYTSRVILAVLGIDDYGIYQAVGGVVAMLSFVNNALSIGSSRFLTFELGAGDSDKLKRTFSSLLTAHILLALAVALLAETAGLWFVYHKLVIPPERLGAAVTAYHFSIVTAVIQIIVVPYSASVIAHERMGVYAYVSILDAVLKLAICYLITVGGLDKLVMYAIFLCSIQGVNILIYRGYCVKHFAESHYRPMWDKPILKNVLGYSGWNLFANTALALITYGSSILLNMFFTSAVVTAMAVSNQVNGAAQQFVNSFRTAANPQIVKKYAVGDLSGSKKLLLASTKYSFYLMLLLAVPLFFVADEVLHLWLKEVPEYTTVFVRVTIATCLFQVFDTSFYTALYAKGRIKENAMLSPSVLFLLFIIVYFSFRSGNSSPLILSFGLCAAYAVLGLFVKPMLIIKIAGYKWREIIDVFVDCIKVFAVAIIIPAALYKFSGQLFQTPLTRSLVLVAASLMSVCASVWVIGLTPEMRGKVMGFIKGKIGKKVS